MKRSSHPTRERVLVCVSSGSSAPKLINAAKRIAANSTLGVLALRSGDPERFLLTEQLRLMESLAKQVALALEVERLTTGGDPLVKSKGKNQENVE